MKGLNFSGLVASVAQASQSFEEISEIDETTDKDISRGVLSSTDTPYGGIADSTKSVIARKNINPSMP